jgi:hypothetical protein
LLRGPLESSWRFLPTTANGRLASGTYLWDNAAGHYVPGGLDVLTISSGHVADVTAFLDADLTRFGLPPSISPQGISPMASTARRAIGGVQPGQSV